MARPRTASQCQVAIPVVVAGKTQTASCSRAEGHRGDHRAAVTWPQRGTPPR